MLKRYLESLNKVEKINLGITGLTVVAGAALWIYGAIEEKRILKEIAEFNEQVERDTVTLNEVIYKSQEEIETSKEYSLFEYYMIPNFDFKQEIISYLDSLEVIEPLSLRKEIGRTMLDVYLKYREDIKR